MVRLLLIVDIMPRYLSAEKRNRLVQLLREHRTLREVATIEGVSPGTVLYAQQRLRQTGISYSRHKSGSPRLISPRHERYMARLLRKGECDNSFKLQNIIRERL